MGRGNCEVVERGVTRGAADVDAAGLLGPRDSLANAALTVYEQSDVVGPQLNPEHGELVETFARRGALSLDLEHVASSTPAVSRGKKTSRVQAVRPGSMLPWISMAKVTTYW